MKNKKKQIFRVNKLLSLKLEHGRTNIYVNGKLFMHCKSLLLINPHEWPGQTVINSIDEATDYNTNNTNVENYELGITPEEEFFGHCSNIQAWVENNYDTSILHTNIAFPLLKKLVDAGDPKAKRVFREEIAKRIMCGYLPVINYLFDEDYLDFLEVEDVKSLIAEYDDLANSSRVVHEIWNIIGLLYHSIEDFDNSMKYLTLALNLDKCSKNIMHNLADLYRNYDFYNRAEELYKIILDFHPNDYRAKIRLGIQYNLQAKFNQAIDLYRQMLTIDPGDPFILNNIGRSYWKTGQIGIAEISFIRALEINPELEQSWSNLGILYFKQRFYDKSLYCFNKRIDIDIDSPKSWYYKARISAIRCEEEKALEFLEQAIKFNIKLKTRTDIKFIDLREKVQEDIHFNNLRDIKKFQKIVGVNNYL